MSTLDVKTLLLRALAIEADARLAEFTFKRTSRSLEFRRKLPDAIQILDITLAVHPSYAHGTLAHIYPKVRLSMPKVCQKAAELVCGNPILLANTPEVMVNRPLDHLVPKLDRVQRYAFKEEDLPVIIRGVVDEFLKWGLPFFDNYRTAADVVKGFDTDDDRPRLQENWAIFVAAAMLVQGNGQRAVDLLESTFCSSGLRHKYAIVFHNLYRMLND